MIAVLRGRKMNEDQIAYIIKDVLHTLIYLQVTTATSSLPHLHHQESRVLHRDVKGSNILLTSNAEVRLVDYGISCQVRIFFSIPSLSKQNCSAILVNSPRLSPPKYKHALQAARRPFSMQFYHLGMVAL